MYKSLRMSAAAVMLALCALAISGAGCKKPWLKGSLSRPHVRGMSPDQLHGSLHPPLREWGSRGACE